MKTLICITLLVLIFGMSSCTSSDYVPGPNGDYAEITLKGNRELHAELLFVTDTMIFVDSKNSIVGLKTKNLDEIKFEKYKDDSWLIGVALLDVLPALIIAISAVTDNDLSPAVYAMIPAAITSTLYILSSPKSTFDNLNKKSDIFELKKFSRYPGGITDRQFKALLKYYKQDTCIYLN
ncbi:MAG TPA: hypothetical protein PKD83_05355 [Ignavibacteria bacterium]|nr:hypothetical protein [Ignavibacteria bacterium]